MRLQLLIPVLGLLLPAAGSAAPHALTLEQTRPGNLFDTGESAGVRVITAATGGTWVVADAHGATVARGALAGAGLLALPLPGPGWYELTVAAAGTNAQARLAVLDPFDLAAVEESPFGVMTHFATHFDTDLIPVLARAGIKHVRDEIHWSAVELERGRYAFPERYERYMGELAAAHLTPLTPLTFGNPLYDPLKDVPPWCAAPYTADGFAGYARYGSAVLDHYGRQIRYVEIWNEYNGGFARGPADGKPEVYAAMLQHAYAAIKRSHPEVRVVAGSTIGISLDWLERVIQCAGITNMDAISVHPYGYNHPPERHAQKLEALRALIRRYHNGKDLPIWVTEQGWFTTQPGELGKRAPITEWTQAQYLVRAWTLFLAHGVEKSFWYLARDDQSFGTMGLVGAPDDARGRYAPKPALVAYATLIRQLTGLTYAGRDRSDPFVHSYRFTRGRRQVHVAWATQPTTIAAPVRHATDLMGRAQRLARTLPLDGTPLFLHGRYARLTTLATQPPAAGDTPPANTAFTPVPPRTIVVDADLADWQGAARIDLTNGTYQKLTAAYGGTNDLSGTCMLAWDATNLYFAAQIRDDTFDQQHTGFNVWKGDNIQIGLSADMPWTGGEWENGWRELGVSLTSRGPEFCDFGLGRLAGIPVAVVREAPVTRYECAIPWRELSPALPAAGAFSFGIFVNDSDGQGRRGYLQWADIKRLDRMQPCRLENPPPSPNPSPQPSPRRAGRGSL